MEFNFSFLKKNDIFESFSNACVEAEKSLVVSYATTAILSRRALELAVKWVFSYEEELTVPYQDKLSALIHDYNFKNIIDISLFPMLKYIIKLGNSAVHTNKNLTREEAVLSLRNLHAFVSWIDYCYSKEYSESSFDESLLQDSVEQKKTRKELQDLFDRLGAKDKKLEDIIKENEELRKKLSARRQENEKDRDFKVDEISEFKTRKLYIDLEIKLSGWNIGRDCIEEVKVKGMPNNSEEGYIDYVLYGDDHMPLAVIEAKRTSVDARKGKQQAKLYADCLENEYGRRPVIFYTNGFEYYLWDDTNYPERNVSGIYTKEDLEWTIFKRNNKSSLKSIFIRDDITNREYQKRAITAVCDTLEKGHRKALLVMATGSGKTRTAISIVDVLANKGWVKNILFLADRRTLVKQAKKNFKNHLTNLTMCNLLNSKDDSESRMIFSTYPTMMNAIDESKKADGSKLFTPGHFDLIIIDESHRSIYKKYQAIFNYFDGILLGLTATPKNEIDKNTYEIFELENNVPTFAYELGEAINDGYLVLHHSIETKLKFQEEGIHYDELSEEEKEKFEETFDDDVKDISGEALNKFLFNNNTVDLVLAQLMEKGIKVEGGDKLGKTIIFAKNKKHADFINKRFNIKYPEYKDAFMKLIYNDIKYVETTIDDFSTKDKLPQIAVSVDMLDTGIDIPELVNLVFFKKIRSKTKFWQMIGRGTRLCPDLFGVGIDKDGFRIFDYCSNFEYFRENPNGKEIKQTKSLTENLFNVKIDIIRELQNFENQTEEYEGYRDSLVKEIVGMINMIDETKFNTRQKIEYIHKYKNIQQWEAISDKDIRDLEEHVAPLIPSIDDDELAKRFDYLMLTIEHAHLKGRIASKPKTKVVSTAEKLSHKGSIEQVKRQKEIIERVQTDDFWKVADVFDYELVRIALRELIKFLETSDTEIYYTDFTDSVMSVEEHRGEYTVNDLKSYRIKVSQYLKEHKDDLVIYKLRNNQKLSIDDIKYLEEILWHKIGTKDEYKNTFGEESLTKLVRKIVGLDAKAANEAFSEFLSNESLNIQQMEFVKSIVNFIVTNGIMDKALLNEHPFNKNGSVVQLFQNKIDVVKKIISKIDEINENAEMVGA